MADKKYYMKPVDGDWYDWEVYYSEDQAMEDLFWAGGDRDFKDINSSLVSDVKKCLTDAYSDIEDTYYLEDEETGDIDEEEIAKTVTETIKYYFKKSDGSALRNSDINKLSKLVVDYNETTRGWDDELSIVCEVLEIYYGKPFCTGTLRGSSSSDWMACVYPKELEDLIPYIEAVLMGTGTEFAISIEKIDLPEGGDLFGEDVYYDYTELWRDDDIINWAAQNLGCSPSEIVLLSED